MRGALVLAALLLGACTGPGSIEFGGGTMGTSFSVKLPGAANDFDEATLRAGVVGVLDDVNRMMSTYMPESEISQFNASASTDWHTVSKEFCESVAASIALSELTNGAFDITAGPLVNLWGFGPEETTFGPPDDQDVEAARSKVGFRHLETDCSIPALRRDIPGLTLDMSAMGKGYAADRVAEILVELGATDYMVEVGGEIRVGGSNAKGKEWAIGIEIPRAGKREPYAIVHLTNVAVATSGDYRNFFEYEGVRYSHEIDTHTGYPVTHELAAVSIIAESGARADALATALLVMGPEAGLELASRENIAALFLTRTATGVEESSSPRFATLRRTL